MKAVAVNPFVPEAAGQGKAPGNLGNRTMESGIETDRLT